MRRRKRLLIGLTVAGLLAACATSFFFLAGRLSPVERALVGRWDSPVLQDGSTSTLELRPDRSCRVRLLDGAGNETSDNPPWDGYWGVESGLLVVEVREPAAPFRSIAGALGIRLSANVRTFVIEENELVQDPGSLGGVTLHRAGDEP
jgi:hypothetical protein